MRGYYLFSLTNLVTTLRSEVKAQASKVILCLNLSFKYLSPPRTYVVGVGRGELWLLYVVVQEY